MTASERPSCVHCKFFYITWELPDSRGCEAFGFKSPRYSSLVVHEVSGTECRLYERKQHKKRSEKRAPRPS